MRNAAATAISSPVELALILRVPATQLGSVLPVALQPLDAFAEPEPSRGATVQLASGRHVVVIYGDVSERLSLHVAVTDGGEAVEDFLTETRLPPSALVWRHQPRVSSSA